VSWGTVTLGAIANIKTGKLDVNAGTPEGKYPFFTCAKKEYAIDFYEYDCECVLVAGNGDLNVKYFKGKFNAYQRTYIITKQAQVDLDMKYLYFFIDSYIERLREGAIGGVIKYIKLGHLTDMNVPLPPLSVQKQIAAVLEKADILRSQCQQMEQELNSLAQSVFLDMFGDPVSNPKGWKTSFLSNHGNFKNGLNFAKGESGVSLKYLGVGDFKSLDSISRLDKLGVIELSKLPMQDYFLEKGDIVFVRSNGNKALVGRCLTIYPDEKVTYSGFCIRYRIQDTGILPEYLNYLFKSNSMKESLLQGGQGANIQNINQKTLSSIPVPLPPLELQRTFVKALELLRVQRKAARAQSEALESLFSSLMQRAFKGELDLKDVA
jgi:type I restriction enzyme S subunit